MDSTPSFAFVPFASLLLLGACSGERAIGPDSTGADDDSTKTDAGQQEPDDTADDDTADAVEWRCEVTEYPEDLLETRVFERLEATVVDTQGDPVPEVTAQACGVNLCLYGDTDRNGEVLHDELAELQKVAFKYGDGLRYAQFALVLPDASVHSLGEQTTAAFPNQQTGEAFVPGEVLRSGEIELELAADSQVSLDVLTFPEPGEQVFVATEFPLDRIPQAAEDFEFVIALGLIKTKFCPPATLRVPNRPGWEAGAQVDVFFHATDTRAEWAPYGEWAQVSSARVSADSAMIETLDGEGIPMLGVLGFRVEE